MGQKVKPERVPSRHLHRLEEPVVRRQAGTREYVKEDVAIPPHDEQRAWSAPGIAKVEIERNP